MGKCETNRIESDNRGNLLAIGAVALVVLLVVASTAMVTTRGPKGGTAPEPAATTELVESGVENELERASEPTNGTAGHTASVNVTGSVGVRTGSSPAARRAVARAFDDRVPSATRKEVAGLLTSLAKQQRQSGAVTAIEPTEAGVEFGVKVELGERHDRAATSAGIRTAVVRTVEEQPRTVRRKSHERPGPEFERAEQVGTKPVLVDSTISEVSPGEGWTPIRVVDAESPRYERTRSVSRPGPGWTRLGPNGTTEVITNRTVATESPGADWKRLEAVGSANRNPNASDAVENLSADESAVGSDGDNASPWRKESESGTPLYERGYEETVTTYDWRRMGWPAEVSVEYGKFERRPVFRWTKGTTETVTGREEIRTTAHPMAPSDARQLLLEGAEGVRDSSMSFVSMSLPIGGRNATVISAVPDGVAPGAVDPEDEWTLRLYRVSNGSTIVDIEGERVISDGETTVLDLDEMAVNGTTLDVPTPSEVVNGSFDLALENGGGVQGTYSLFATNQADSEMRPIENVTVERAISSATFDVTYQDQRTTYTDTIVVEPDQAPLSDIEVERTPINDTDGPPQAAFTVSEQTRNDSHVTYRLNARPTTAEDRISTYEWAATDYASRVSNLIDGLSTQTIIVERDSSDYYLPIELRVVDEEGLENSTEEETNVPGSDNQPPNAGLEAEQFGTINNPSGYDEEKYRVAAGEIGDYISDTWRNIEPVSEDSDGTIDDYDYSWRFGPTSNVRVLDRADNNEWVDVAIQRQESGVTLGVSTTVTDDDGATDTTSQTVELSAGDGPPTSDLNITIKEISRTRNEVRYNVAADSSVGIFGWQPSNEGRVRNLTDGPYNQTFTTDRFEDSWELTITGTQRAGGTIRDGSDTVTVPGTNVPQNQPPEAIINATQTGGNSSHVTYELSGVQSSDDDGTIVQYEWQKTDPSGTVSSFESTDKQMTVDLTRPAENNGPRTIPVTLTVSDDDGASGTDSTTLTVEPITEPPTDVTADLSLSRDQIYDNGTVGITVDASESNAKGGRITSYSFTKTARKGSFETTPEDGARNAVQTVRYAPTEGTMKLAVTVTVEDNNGNSATATEWMNMTDPRLFTELRPDLDSKLLERRGDEAVFEINASDSTGPKHDKQYTVREFQSEGSVTSSLINNTETQTVTVDLSEDDPDAVIELAMVGKGDDGGYATDTTKLSADPNTTDIAPTADLTATRVDYRGDEADFRISASGSTDPDGTIEEYDYSVRQFQSAGTVTSSLTNGAESQIVTVDLSEDDPDAVISLTVTDDDDKRDTTTVELSDDPNAAPTAAVGSRIVDRGEGTATFEIDARDSFDKDGFEDALDYAYSVDREQSQGSIVDGPQDGSGMTTVTVGLTEGGPDAVVEVSVTDRYGASDTQKVRLTADPKPLEVDLTTSVDETQSTVDSATVDIQAQTSLSELYIKDISYDARAMTGTLSESVADNRAVQSVTVERDGDTADLMTAVTVTDKWGRTATADDSASHTLGSPPVAKLDKTELPNEDNGRTTFEVDSTSSTDPDGEIVDRTYRVVQSESPGSIVGPMPSGESSEVTIAVTEDNPDVVLELTVEDDKGQTDTAKIGLDGDTQPDGPKITRTAVDPDQPRPHQEATLFVETENEETVDVFVDGDYHDTVQTRETSLPGAFGSGVEAYATLSERFHIEGEHTVTFTASNDGGTDSETVTFEVKEVMRDAGNLEIRLDNYHENTAEEIFGGPVDRDMEREIQYTPTIDWYDPGNSSYIDSSRVDTSGYVLRTSVEIGGDGSVYGSSIDTALGPGDYTVTVLAYLVDQDKRLSGDYLSSASESEEFQIWVPTSGSMSGSSSSVSSPETLYDPEVGLP